MRNLPLTPKILQFAAKAIGAQQNFLDSLAMVDLDNMIAFDYLLAEQGDVCVAANTTCCTWVNTLGELNTAPQYY